jgi:hypothetical protein
VTDILRTHAAFAASFESEPEFAPTGGIERPAGRDALVVLASALTERGFHVSEPALRDYYGWEVVATNGPGRYWLLLQVVDHWLLTCADITWFAWLRAGANARHEELLRTMGEILGGDPRFSDVRWFTAKEYEAFERRDAPAAPET